MRWNETSRRWAWKKLQEEASRRAAGNRLGERSRGGESNTESGGQEGLFSAPDGGEVHELRESDAQPRVRDRNPVSVDQQQTQVQEDQVPGEQPREDDSGMVSGEFETQRYERRFYMILWRLSSRPSDGQNEES